MQAFIGRIEEYSTSIWKGKKSFVIYFAGCNFNCPFCNTPDILNTKKEFLIDIKDIKKQIKENSHAINTVFFTGGEACMQRQALISIAGYCKELGLKVGIATNGSKPDSLRSLLDQNLLDYTAIDIKSPLEKEIFQKVTKSSTFFITDEEIIKETKKTIALLKKNEERLQIEFRTTIIPGLMFKKEDIEKIGETIEKIDCRWILQRFKPNNLKNKTFSQINSPSVEFVSGLKESLQKKFPGLRIIKETE